MTMAAAQLDVHRNDLGARGSPFEAAARLMANGHPLAALDAVARREEPVALALRAIAMAQFGELRLAARLLRRAAVRFGVQDATSRARCVLMEAEIALVAHDVAWPDARLERARAKLEQAGDRGNAAHARHLAIRRLCMAGRLDAAGRALDAMDIVGLPPRFISAHHLLAAHIAARTLRAADADRAVGHAALAAEQAGHPILLAEVDKLRAALDRPVARLMAHQEQRAVTLREIAALDDAIIIDACRRSIRRREDCRQLANRPIQFALARALAEAWPQTVARRDLIARLFGDRTADWNSRARLRVAIGRLRVTLAGLLAIETTDEGFAFGACGGCRVIVLAPPIEHRDAAVLALLEDGASWSSAALALALDASQRSVQRSLEALSADLKIVAIGHGRARRWRTRARSDFATWLLLPVTADTG